MREDKTCMKRMEKEKKKGKKKNKRKRTWWAERRNKNRFLFPSFECCKVVTPRPPRANETNASSWDPFHATGGALIFQGFKVLFTDPAITIIFFLVLWLHLHDMAN